MKKKTETDIEDIYNLNCTGLRLGHWLDQCFVSVSALTLLFG